MSITTTKQENKQEPMNNISTISANILKQYLNPAFVETGVWNGDGLLEAKKAGFKQLYSIEIDPHIAASARRRVPEAIIVIGDARSMIKFVINKIKQPITFWLDGHDSCSTSILEELSIISRYPLVEKCIILIDDIRVFRDMNNVWGVDINKLTNMAVKVKKQSKISFIDSTLFPQDIMVIQ
jgi:hypothetical protein